MNEKALFSLSPPDRIKASRLHAESTRQSAPSNPNSPAAGGRTTLNTLWMSCRFLLETPEHVLILIEFSEISPLLFILCLSSESFPLFSSSLFELPYELGILPQGENVVMMPVFLLGETAVCAFYIWLVQFIWNSPLY